MPEVSAHLDGIHGSPLPVLALVRLTLAHLVIEDHEVAHHGVDDPVRWKLDELLNEAIGLFLGELHRRRAVDDRNRARWPIAPARAAEQPE